MPTIEVSIVMFLIQSILCYVNYEKKIINYLYLQHFVLVFFLQLFYKLC